MGEGEEEGGGGAPPASDALTLVVRTGALDKEVVLPLGDGNGDAIANVTIDWGDATANSTCDTVVSNWGIVSCLMPQEDTEYTISITGRLSHYGSMNSWNQDRIIRVDSWGDLGTTDLSFAFLNATNLEFVAPPPSIVTKVSGMFAGASLLNVDISSWDVSKVTDMSLMFSEAHDFNQDISGWNVSSVTDVIGFSVNSGLDPGNRPDWGTDGSGCANP